MHSAAFVIFVAYSLGRARIWNTLVVDTLLGAVATVTRDSFAAIVCECPALIVHRSAGVAVAARVDVGRLTHIVSTGQIPASYDHPIL